MVKVNFKLKFEIKSLSKFWNFFLFKLSLPSSSFLFVCSPSPLPSPLPSSPLPPFPLWSLFIYSPDESWLPVGPDSGRSLELASIASTGSHTSNQKQIDKQKGEMQRERVNDLSHRGERALKVSVRTIIHGSQRLDKRGWKRRGKAHVL